MPTEGTSREKHSTSHAFASVFSPIYPQYHKYKRTTREKQETTPSVLCQRTPPSVRFRRIFSLTEIRRSNEHRRPKACVGSRWAAVDIFYGRTTWGYFARLQEGHIHVQGQDFGSSELRDNTSNNARIRSHSMLLSHVRFDFGSLPLGDLVPPPYVETHVRLFPENFHLRSVESFADVLLQPRRQVIPEVPRHYLVHARRQGNKEKQKKSGNGETNVLTCDYVAA